MINNIHWQQLVNRITQEVEYQLRNNNGAKEQGVVYINLKLLADCNRPLTWIVVDGKRIEPSSRAKELLELL